jgi:site-specific DNA-cytosine methylase
MTHASLFSGIGGFDLAAKWAGFENIFACENNKFCQKVLRYHFPNTIIYDDITTADFTAWQGKIDVVSGGFPTQSPVCRRDDGLSARLDGITFPKWRSESIKAYGNAIVPQIAYEIFKAINETNKRPFPKLQGI